MIMIESVIMVMTLIAIREQPTRMSFGVFGSPECKLQLCFRVLAILNRHGRPSAMHFATAQHIAAFKRTTCGKTTRPLMLSWAHGIAERSHIGALDSYEMP